MVSSNALYAHIISPSSKSCPKSLCYLWILPYMNLREEHLRQECFKSLTTDILHSYHVPVYSDCTLSFLKVLCSLSGHSIFTYRTKQYCF